ncbi:MAG: lipid-A-disaccharide synthase [Syntrophales bacterium]|nr:lipid-A-disaccharide synthase [Syntrophales bacterium]
MNSREGKKVLIVAGEASGDLHGAQLVTAMKNIVPALTFYGVGGERLRNAGVRLMAHAADMAVVGLTEVIAKLPKILAVRQHLQASFTTEKPALVILIDYPDFNLPLARAAKKKGIKVFYYISPQVWAWRRGRIEEIRRNVDAMAVILPFEEEFYARYGLKATFVGHPLLDVVSTPHGPEEARRRLGLDEACPTVGLLPGSRMSEVKKLLPVMIQAGRIIQECLGEVQFVLPVAETLEHAVVEDCVADSGLTVLLTNGGCYDALAAADMAIVASGTATLETALMGRPMVIIYKVSLLTYLLGRIFVHVENIGLVNIIAGRTVVPELIQGQASPENIATAALDIMTDPGRREAIIQELSQIRGRLGQPGAAQRAAALACGML